jgi:hypothetical protein
MAAEDTESVTVVAAIALSSAVAWCNFFDVILYSVVGCDIHHT